MQKYHHRLRYLGKASSCSVHEIQSYSFLQLVVVLSLFGNFQQRRACYPSAPGNCSIVELLLQLIFNQSLRSFSHKSTLLLPLFLMQKSNTWEIFVLCPVYFSNYFFPYFWYFPVLLYFSKFFPPIPCITTQPRTIIKVFTLGKRIENEIKVSREKQHLLIIQVQ